MRIEKNLVFKFDEKTWKTVSSKNRTWTCINVTNPDEILNISSAKIASSLKEDLDKNTKKSIKSIASSLEIGINFFDEFGNVMSIKEKLPDGFWLCELNSQKNDNNDGDIAIYYSEYIAISIHYFGTATFYKGGSNNNDSALETIEIDKIKKEKQRKSSKKYNESEAGKEALMKYRMSEKGKEAISKAIKKYFSTEKGKAAKSRYMKKYKARPEVQERQRERDRARDRKDYMRNYMREKRKKDSENKSP